MRTLPIIIIICVLPFVTDAQAGDTLDQRSIGIINQIVKDNRSWILLVREIENYTIKEMIGSLGKGVFIKRIVDENGNDVPEKLVLSTDELKSLKRAVANMKNFQWREADANKLNLDGIKTINSDSSLHPDLDISIKYRIVPPIFIRNGEYSFLYFDYACGPLCGATRFEILRKTLNGWKIWKTLILRYY